MKMKFGMVGAFALVSILLGGCAPMAALQKTCERQNKSFVSMVDCLNRGADENSQIRNNNIRRQYLAYANLLVEKVQNGSISEVKARYLLAEKYSSLSSELKSQANAIPLWIPSQQRQITNTNCIKSGDYVNCSTY